VQKLSPVQINPAVTGWGICCVSYSTMESTSFAFKIHHQIQESIKRLQWNYYFPVKWSPETSSLILRTSLESRLTFVLCTILELVLVFPGLVLTPVVIQENSENIKLCLIPGLKWICMWVSILLFQLPVYLYRYELKNFLNLFLALDLSGLKEGE